MRKRTVWKLPWCSGILGSIFFTFSAVAQNGDTTNAPIIKSVPAESSFLSGISNQGAMGRRYRLEWSVPVQAPQASLDQLYGGLMPLKREDVGATTILYLHSNDGKLFALRPLRVSPERQLPEIYQNSVISGFAADLASAYHPYAPLTIAPLAKAANLPFAPVKLIYLQQQSSLGPHKDDWGNDLYFLHQQPFSLSADTLSEVVSTKRLLHLLDSSSRYRVNETAYLRSRLLDMLLGIALRRPEDWRWIAQKEGNVYNYTPYTESYEGAYALYEGSFIKIARVIAKPKGLVPFEANLPDPVKLNATALYLDHRFTAGLSREDWEQTAHQLQQALTDEVLQTAVRQMPAEVLQFSGQAILAKLRSRRNELAQYALKYYDLLAREVDVTASAANETITISSKGDGKLNVIVQPQASDTEGAATPLISRSFEADETRSVNLYGRGGRDHFVVEGTPGRKIKVRAIGGPDHDSLIGDPGGRIHYYDDETVRPLRSRQVRLHLRNNASVHRYDWEDFTFDRRGLSPIIFYNNNDRIYAGLSYQWIKQGWRKQPFAQQHKLQVNYSILQGGFSGEYEGIFNQLIGKWNGLVLLEYDAVRWTNFFGIGNESPPQVEDNTFYRMRTAISNASVGLFRNFGKGHSIGFSGLHQTVRILKDEDRYVAKYMTDHDPLLFKTHQFAGARATYSFQGLDNELNPHKGLLAQGSASYLKNLTEGNKETMSYDASLQTFIPFGNRLVWSMLGGVKAVTGEPEFYQMAVIGGGSTLRGYRRERFWGKTAFYTQNELQYLIPYRSYWFNGTIGFFALFDAGRVWQPGEISDVLHKSYGGGLILSPFHKVQVSLAYAKSAEHGLFHVGLRGRL